jgi:hypothetical protein
LQPLRPGPTSRFCDPCTSAPGSRGKPYACALSLGASTAHLLLSLAGHCFEQHMERLLPHSSTATVTVTTSSVDLHALSPFPTSQALAFNPHTLTYRPLSVPSPNSSRTHRRQKRLVSTCQSTTIKGCVLEGLPSDLAHTISSTHTHTHTASSEGGVPITKSSLRGNRPAL